MKRVIFLALLGFLMACGRVEIREARVRAVDGIDGQDGANGHSIVSWYREASQCECESSGQALDMYIDLDDNLEFSEGDLYSNSLVSCNGANGLNGEQGATGEQGPQGIAGEVGPQGEAGEQGEAGPTGPQGPAGPQGLQGEAGSSATIASYSANSCTNIAGTSSYVKKHGSNFKLYTSSSCHSWTAFAEVSQGESYWVSGSALAVHANNSLRVITFN